VGFFFLADHSQVANAENVIGYAFQALSAFSFVCWVAPTNVPINQLFGVESGLGMSFLTFDWPRIAWIGSPLMGKYNPITMMWHLMKLTLSSPMVGRSQHFHWLCSFLLDISPRLVLYQRTSAQYAVLLTTTQQKI